MPEVRRLLHLLSQPAARQRQGLAWSHWRRRRHAAARRGHAARRAQQSFDDDVSPCRILRVLGTPALTDAGWAAMAPLLPTSARPGKPWREHRQVVAGILWVMRTGRAWRELPPAFGPWQTAHSRYQRWRRDGAWARLLHMLRQHSPTLPLPP